MKELLGVKSNHSYHICDKWDSKMIRNILIDKEYCGYVINFNYSKKSNVEIKNEFNQIVEEEAERLLKLEEICDHTNFKIAHYNRSKLSL